MRQGTTILVLEDDRMIAGVFCTILRRQGYEVLEAHNPRQAIEVAGASPDPVKLLVCDVVLACEVASPAVAELRHAAGPLSVLYVSGLPLDVLLDRGLLTEREIREPNTFYRQKPFLPNDLVTDVARILAAGTAWKMESPSQARAIGEPPGMLPGVAQQAAIS